jgi:hypothetical protein
MLYDTKARQEFERWVQKVGGPTEASYSLLVIGVSAICNYCAGTRRPEPLVRYIIERHCDIDQEDWLTREERTRAHQVSAAE